jgi:hypothetical protein
VCINLVLAFAVLLKLSLLAINVESAESAQKRVKSNGLFLIKVVWPGESDDDVDTYVSDPLSHLVSGEVADINELPKSLIRSGLAGNH